MPVYQFNSTVSVAPFLTDPLDWTVLPVGGASLVDGAGNQSRVGGFWTSFAQYGDYLALTTGAWREVVSVTGRGKLAAVIGPELAAATDCRITIDGFVYTFPQMTPPANNRIIFNGRAIISGARYSSTAESDAIDSNGRMGDDSYGSLKTSANRILRHPVVFGDHVAFKQNMKVEFNIPSTPATYYKNAGAMWVYDE